MALFTRCGLTNSTSPSCAASYPSVCFVRRCTTTHGPAWSTVHPTSVPSSTNTCVIPSLIPMIPLTAIFLVSLSQHAFKGIGCVLLLGISLYFLTSLLRRFSVLLHRVSERLDFHVHTGRQVQLHQRIHGVRRRLQNVDQTLVRAHFKLLARFLVHVRRPQDRPAVDGGRQRNRPGNIRAGALGRLHDFPRGLVQNSVVVRLQTNTDFVALSHLCVPKPSLETAYSMISVTAPAPTVCPPSRIANRRPFSSATGVINVTSQLTLSPGITISTPAASFISPVTSVVRK